MHKILYVIDRPNLYGSERHLLDTLRFQRVNYKIEVVVFQDGPLVERIERLGVKVENIGLLGWMPSCRALNRFICVVKRFAPDIIHSHQPKANFWGAMVARRMRILHVATLHTMPIQAALVHRFPLRFFVRIFHRGVIECVKLLSTHCIYVSRTAMEQLSSHRRNESYIYNWISPERCANHRLHRGTKNYICVGSISESKGIRELIEWFEWICCKNSEARLTLVGSGAKNYIATIRDYIRDRNLTERIEILDYSDDISSLLEQNDIFISATRSESFGLVFVEAMAQGLPIVTRRIPVLEELIPPKNLLIDNDRMVWSDFESFIGRVEAGTVSTENVCWARSNFDYDTQQRKIADLYDRLLRS